MSSRARNALIAGASTAGVAAVVLLVVFTGHHGPYTGKTLTVPAMRFHVQATVTIPLDGTSDPGCGFAKDALTSAIDDLGKDIDDPAAAAADTQHAIDQAGNAAVAAQSTELKSAVVTMKTHLVSLHAAVVANDFSSEASALQSIQDDMTAVFGACTP